jgi:hypothetical protein
MNTDTPLKWDDSFKEDTVRLAYEHARETHRTIEAAADVLDRKVVGVFGISSAIEALGASLTRAGHRPLIVGLLVGAAGAWLVSSLQSWQAFRPRRYRTDPNPRDFLTPEWLDLGTGPYYLGRLHHVADTVAVNGPANAIRVAALIEHYIR